MALDWLPAGALQQDQTRGTSSHRPRLLWYLEAFAAVSARRDALPGLRHFAQALLEHLSGVWPASATLPLYPALR